MIQCTDKCYNKSNVPVFNDRKMVVALRIENIPPRNKSAL